MKVLFTFGGLPHYYNLVLNKLQQQTGCEVVVIAPAKGNQTIGSGVHQSISGVEFKIVYLKEYNATWGKPFFENFYETIKSEKPDVIVTIWPYFLGLVYNPILLWRIRKLRIKLILKEIPFNIPKQNEFFSYFANGGAFTESLEKKQIKKNLGFYFKYSILKYTLQYAFKMVDAHVDYTEEAFEIFESYGVAKEKIFIIYNSPDTDIIFDEKAKIENLPNLLPNNSHRLLHVGRLVKWKKVDMLIDVFEKLQTKFPNAELCIVGDGPELENLKLQAKELNIGEKVRFVGAVYEMKDLGRYFKESLVYVLAGMGGLSINDAMCFDKPIICSVADGTEKKLVRDGYNGYIFENGNPKDLFQKIDLLLTDTENAKLMGLNSTKIIKDEVNIHVVIKNYLRAFNYVNNK